MSNIAMPKEQLTAYQRWELASFDRPVIVAPVKTISVEEIKQQAATELAYLKKQAYEAGFASGEQAGYAAGTQQAQQAAQQLNQLLRPIQDALNQLDDELAQSLLNLALQVAKKMTIETLQVKPEIISHVVTTAIASLPHFNQNAHLILHPDDAKLVQEHLGEQLNHAGWKIFTDVKIQRGGCRVETAHSHIDATNEARWQHIVASIGQDLSWQA